MTTVRPTFRRVLPDSGMRRERELQRIYETERCEVGCCRTTRHPDSPGKVVYPREKKARRAAHVSSMQHYRCDRCGHWHLTTRRQDG